MSASNVVALPGVDRYAEGAACVDPGELRAKLGHTAWHVWAILCVVREYGSTVHITVNGIARMRGFVRTKPEAVRKALQKLRRAGLVRDIGWRVIDVGRRKRCKRCKVYVREVFGHERLKKRRIRTWTDAEQGPQTEVVVPSTTLLWLSAAAAWGGARSGAGRKSKEAISLANSSENNSSAPVAKESSAPPDLDPSIRVNQERVIWMGVNPHPARAAHGVDFFEDEELGVGFNGGAAIHTPGPSTVLPGVPPFPGVSVAMPARVPHPPLLDPNEQEHDGVRRIVRAFNAAITKRTRAKSGVLVRGDIRASKYWKMLCAARAALIEHGIPPTSWALFSYDVHRTFSKKKKSRPPFPWTWAAKRIEERRGWFRREAGSYGGGRLIFGVRHKYLLHTYEAMRSEIARGDRSVEDAVAHHFPPNASYDRCVAAARAEAAEKTRRLEEQLRRGEFLWG